MNKDKFASAPLYFLDEEKRKEWEKLDPTLKKGVLSHLHRYTKEMEIRNSIEVLCNIIIDLSEQIKTLQEKIK